MNFGKPEDILTPCANSWSEAVEFGVEGAENAGVVHGLREPAVFRERRVTGGMHR
jgi:hypothetical protein